MFTVKCLLMNVCYSMFAWSSLFALSLKLWGVFGASFWQFRGSFWEFWGSLECHFGDFGDPLGDHWRSKRPKSLLLQMLVPFGGLFLDPFWKQTLTENPINFLIIFLLDFGRIFDDFENGFLFFWD